jgi:hypothetical protein
MCSSSPQRSKDRSASIRCAVCPTQPDRVSGRGKLNTCLLCWKVSSGPGTWVVRRYHGRDANGTGVYTVKNLRTPDGKLVLADDYSEPDGQTVLRFGQAQAAALAGRSSSGSGPLGPCTVRRAVEAYLEAKETEGRDIVDARWRVDARRDVRRTSK